MDLASLPSIKTISFNPIDNLIRMTILNGGQFFVCADNWHNANQVLAFIHLYLDSPVKSSKDSHPMNE
jgi:hypothetical protein